MSALLNCPFCGAVPRYLPRALTVHCANCNASLPKVTQHEAIAAWNRRTPPPLPTREALTAALAVIPTGLRNQAMHLPPAMAEAAADAVLRLLGEKRNDG